MPTGTTNDRSSRQIPATTFLPPFGRSIASCPRPNAFASSRPRWRSREGLRHKPRRLRGHLNNAEGGITTAPQAIRPGRTYVVTVHGGPRPVDIFRKVAFVTTR